MGNHRAEPGRRRRRTAEEARHAILEAAQKRLVECGPEEIRLQDIASDLGISHPAILHHFGSREGLMRALSQHAFQSLNADMVAALDGSTESGVTPWLDRAFETLGDRGHARLLAWGMLTGRLGGSDGEGRGDAPRTMLLDLARAVHERRCAIAGASEDTPDLEESVFAVQLVSAALLGDALMGPVLRASAGLKTDDGGEDRFRAWLGRRLEELLIPEVRNRSAAPAPKSSED